MLMAAVAGGAIVWFQTRPAARRVTRLAISAPGPSALSVAGRDMAITPDGTQVAWVGNNARQLFVRAFDQTDAVPLVGADFPSNLFIKPDGQWVGFVGEFVLRKVAINGGAVQSLLKLGARSMLGATWGERGTIIFATERTSTGLEQISEDGGATTMLTRPNRERGEDYHAWPSFLPGSQAVLFTVLHAGGIDSAEIAVLDLTTGKQKVILTGGSAPRYLSSGHLVYGAAGSLRAVAFDLERLEIRGTPVTVVPQLLTTPNGAADFDVASDGTLVYVRGGVQEPARTLLWVDREGREEPIPAPVRAYMYLRISPDGSRAAIDVRDQERDIWLWEFARGRLTRFTFAPKPDRFPVWTFDGRRILYTSERPGASEGTVTRNLFSKASDRMGVEEQLTQNTTTADKAPTGVSPDGMWVILRDGEPQAFDVSRLALELDESGAAFGEDVHASMIFVDGVSVGEPDEFALRDRRKLSDDGVFIVVATISSDDGSQVADPEVIFRGVPFAEEADGLRDELRDVVQDTLNDAADEEIREVSLLQQDLHDDIAEFVYEKLHRRPLVLPVVVEV